MDACMHDCAKEYRKHGEIKSNMLQPRVTTPFGKGYGLKCTCITGSTKVPELQPPPNFIGYRDNTWSNIVHWKV